MTVKKRKTSKTKKVATPTPEPSNRVSNYAIPIGLLWVLISLAIGLGIVFMTLSDKLDSLENKITGQNQELQDVQQQKEKLEDEKKQVEEKLKEVLTTSTLSNDVTVDGVDDNKE